MSNVVDVIRGMDILFEDSIRLELFNSRDSEFVPVHTFDNKDFVFTKHSLDYSSYFPDNLYRYAFVTILPNGIIRLGYNPAGRINTTLSAGFDVNMTEEDLFQLSTIQDNFGIEVADIGMFKKIWELYYESTI